MDGMNGPQGTAEFNEVTTANLFKQLETLHPELFESISSISSASLQSGGKARVPFNQPFCDRLKEKSEHCKRDGRQKLHFTYDKARRSIIECTFELRSRNDFMKLRGIGPFVARELQCVLNDILGSSAPTDAAPKDKPNAKEVKVRSTSNRRTLSLDPSSTKTTESAQNLKKSGSFDLTTSTQTVSLVRKSSISRTASVSSSSASLVRTSSLTEAILLANSTSLQRSQSLNSLPQVQKRMKEDTVSSQELVVDYPDDAQVVLLLDSREVGSLTERHFFENKLREVGVDLEVRGLPLGDFLWIIRVSSGQEFICDTIVERKTADDLIASIIDGRYKEQKSRLNDSGLDKKIYIIEGDIRKTSTDVPVKMLQTAIIETRLKGFLVQQTYNRDATCDYIHRLHKSVQLKLSQKKYSLDEANLWSNFQERARYQPCETVGEAFQAMLVQVPGCSSERARGITAIYPTPRSLIQGYLSTRENHRKIDEWKYKENMLQDIVYGISKRRLGPKLSSTFAHLYCLKSYTHAPNEDDDGAGDTELE